MSQWLEVQSELMSGGWVLAEVSIPYVVIAATYVDETYFRLNGAGGEDRDDSVGGVVHLTLQPEGGSVEHVKCHQRYQWRGGASPSRGKDCRPEMVGQKIYFKLFNDGSYKSDYYRSSEVRAAHA